MYEQHHLDILMLLISSEHEYPTLKLFKKLNIDIPKKLLNIREVNKN